MAFDPAAYEIFNFIDFFFFYYRFALRARFDNDRFDL